MYCKITTNTPPCERCYIADKRTHGASSRFFQFCTRRSRIQLLLTMQSTGYDERILDYSFVAEVSNTTQKLQLNNALLNTLMKSPSDYDEQNQRLGSRKRQRNSAMDHNINTIHRPGPVRMQQGGIHPPRAVANGQRLMQHSSRSEESDLDSLYGIESPASVQPDMSMAHEWNTPVRECSSVSCQLSLSYSFKKPN